MHYFSKIILTFLFVLLLCPANVFSKGQHKEQHNEQHKEQIPLKVMTAGEWVGLSKKEQGLIIMGVLEGWSFDLFNQNHPHLKTLVDCVEKEGIGKFVDAVNALLVSDPDDAKFPTPWWVSKSFGFVCQKHNK